MDIGPHVFPTRKYRLVRDRLLGEGSLRENDCERPVPATDREIALVHTEAYLDKIRAGRLSPREEALLEVPFSAALREAMWLSVGGSILTARRALATGRAVHLGGGFHHAFADHGEGFCLVNDIAVAVRVCLAEGAITRALVIDLDVHHGNGTAAVFAGEADVVTCSFHQEHNYPAWKPPSDLDVDLADGTDDEEYLALVAEHLPKLIARVRPDLVFFLAGADPYREDQLGGLGLTVAGLRARDDAVLRFAGTIPVAIVLAGGYARDPNDTVEIHCGTVRAALGA